jgi:hypothetical protein
MYCRWDTLDDSVVNFRDQYLLAYFQLYEPYALDYISMMGEDVIDTSTFTLLSGLVPDDAFGWNIARLATVLPKGDELNIASAYPYIITPFKWYRSFDHWFKLRFRRGPELWYVFLFRTTANRQGNPAE